MSEKSFLVFTVATKSYEPFVLPYVTSILTFNLNTFVEIALEAPRQFEVENADALEILTEHVGQQFQFVRQTERNRVANSLRFTMQPVNFADEVYIGDIDILILEDIQPIHHERMHKTGLPYSNIMRPGKKFLSGLHFTKWAAFYPQVLLEGESIYNLDEKLLYELVKAKGNPLPDPRDTYRPVHGYHLSINRMPYITSGWSNVKSESYLESYLKLCQTTLWKRIAPLFDRRYLQLISILEAGLVGRFPDQMTGHKTIYGCMPKHWWS